MDTSLKDIIEQKFTETIQKFGFKIEDKSKHWEHIELSNDNCIIRFINDFGSIEISFVRPYNRISAEKIKQSNGFPKGYPIYPIYFVWESLYPNDKTNFRVNSWDKAEQVNAAKQLIEDRFENILSGDFSWTKSIK